MIMPNNRIAYAFLVYILLCVIGSSISTKSKVIAECEKKAHSSLTPQQRGLLCKDADLEFGLGPAVCSVAAKDFLHLPFDQLLKICQHASTAAPVDCVKKLDTTSRQKVGFDLCHKATNSFPAECYSQLTHTVNLKPSIKQQLNKLKSTQIIEFCSQIEELSPINCLMSSLNVTTIAIDQGLLLCKNAIGYGQIRVEQQQVVSNCILEMATFLNTHKLLSTGTSTLHTNPNHHRMSNILSPEDVVQFCVNINYHAFPNDFLTTFNNDFVLPAPAVTCFTNLHKELQELQRKDAQAFSKGSNLKTYDKLQICHNAPNDDTPVQCTIQLFQKLQERESSTKLSGEEISTLCQSSSTNTGPVDCFLSSKNVGNAMDRAELCHLATNSGPANCYRKAMTAFRQDDESRLLLCVGAMSEGPAACATEAPQYLSNEEKVHLCSNAPISQYSDPIKCLQSVQSTSRGYPNAPKKTLGYPLENLSTDQEWTSRALMISLCSFSDSSFPLFSAQCFKNIPRNIPHDEAILLCTNTTTTQTTHHLTYCQRTLAPVQVYNATQILILCNIPESRPSTPQSNPNSNGNTVQSEHLEAIMSCASYIPKHLTRPYASLLGTSSSLSTLTKTIGQSNAILFADQVVKLCSEEDANGLMLQCLKELGTYLATQKLDTMEMIGNHAQGNAWTSDLLIQLCAEKNAVMPSTNAKPKGNASPAISSSSGSTKNSACMVNILQEYTNMIGSSTTSSVITMDPTLLQLFTELCTSTSVTSMQSMIHYQSRSNKHLTYYQKVLKCLLTRQKHRIFTSEDIAVCQNPAHYTLQTIRIKSVQSEGVHIKNNEYFGLQFELYDQYNTLYLPEELMVGNNNNPENTKKTTFPTFSMPQFEIAININNPQNAVLWGNRRNISAQGILSFHSLMISQPGNVTVQVLRNTDGASTTAAAGAGRNSNKQKKEVLYSFVLMVAVNEEYRLMNECVSLFHRSISPYVLTTTFSPPPSNETTSSTTDPKMAQELTEETSLPRQQLRRGTKNVSKQEKTASSTTSKPSLAARKPSLDTISDTEAIEYMRADTVYESDMQSLYPLIRSYHPETHYLINIHCAAHADLFTTQYHMMLSLLPSGQLFIEYRIGIDSIWTGIGLPRLEMSPTERLQLMHLPPAQSLLDGLNSNPEVKGNMRQRKKEIKQRQQYQKEILKSIKRAYYKMSLLWHPDRWAAYPVYVPIVQNIFPLISEAYELLVTEYSISLDDQDEKKSGLATEMENQFA